MKKGNKYLKILIYIVYAIVIIFAFLAVSSKFSIGGLKLLVVKSGSMEPAIKTGSMVVGKSASDYNIGEVITFKNTGKPTETTTHRIYDKECQNDVCTFTTKGDANDAPDFETVIADRIEGKVMLAVPYFGYITNFARTLPGLIILIIIPAVIIIYEEIRKIHNETKQIIHRRKKKKEEVKKDKDRAEKNKAKVIGNKKEELK